MAKTALHMIEDYTADEETMRVEQGFQVHRAGE